MVYLLLWFYELFLDDDDGVFLESMLIEIELRWYKNYIMDNKLNVLFFKKVGIFVNFLIV